MTAEEMQAFADANNMSLDSVKTLISEYETLYTDSLNTANEL